MSRQSGFSFAELAVALAIVGTLAALASTALIHAPDSAQRRGTVSQAEQARDAIRSFAAREARLPCPDDRNNPDGQEDCDGAASGWVPYATLGLARPETSNRARYAVYQGGGAGDQLTAARDRTGNGIIDAADFLVAVRAAADVGVRNGSAHLVTDPRTNCGQGRAVGFFVALPGRDADGDGTGFDGQARGACAPAPAIGRRADYDDVVVADAFPRLAGWLTQQPTSIKASSALGEHEDNPEPSAPSVIPPRVRSDAQQLRRQLVDDFQDDPSIDRDRLQTLLESHGTAATGRPAEDFAGPGEDGLQDAIDDESGPDMRDAGESVTQQRDDLVDGLDGGSGADDGGLSLSADERDRLGSVTETTSSALEEGGEDSDDIIRRTVVDGVKHADLRTYNDLIDRRNDLLPEDPETTSADEWNEVSASEWEAVDGQRLADLTQDIQELTDYGPEGPHERSESLCQTLIPVQWAAPSNWLVPVTRQDLRNWQWRTRLTLWEWQNDDCPGSVSRMPKPRDAGGGWDVTE
jgi:prepilin-type N-terminal cleavage/methylation domain-containing protein